MTRRSILGQYHPSHEDSGFAWSLSSRYQNHPSLRRCVWLVEFPSQPGSVYSESPVAKQRRRDQGRLRSLSLPVRPGLMPRLPVTQSLVTPGSQEAFCSGTLYG